MIIHLRRDVATAGSFACLAAQALWALVCYLVAQAAPPDNWLAGFLGLLAAGLVMGLLALVGSGLALLAVSGRRRTAWAVVALVLNLLVLLGTTLPLRLLLGPTH
jgi:hypothetical protein